MTQNYLKSNLAYFRKIQPAAADRIEAAPLTGKYQVTPSKSGPMSLVRIYPDGTRRTLHSSFNPRKEAKHWLDSQWVEPSLNFILYGVGLGYLLQEWALRSSRSARILVIENEWEMLKLAFTHLDWIPILEHPGIHWIFSNSTEALLAELEPFKLDYAVNGYLDLSTPPLLEMEDSEYPGIPGKVQAYFQEARVHLNTQQAFSKTVYGNILANLDNLVSSQGIQDYKDLFPEKPFIVVSAGPSLDKNIHLLKQAESRAYLISVSTALNTLLKNGVSPDFIVAIDPTHISVDAFDLENIPENSWLIYDPSIPTCIPNAFGDKKIAIEASSPLYQWLDGYMESKGDPGPASSVAHVALYLADYFGGNPLVLVGQDLAFDGNRLHCSGVYYAILNYLNAKQNVPSHHFNQARYRENASRMKPALDVFGNVALTTQAMNSYKEIFSRERATRKKIFNATEGGIPIPGIQNVTLKEILNSQCSKKITKNHADFPRLQPSSVIPSQFFKDLNSLLDLFRNWAEILSDIQKQGCRENANLHLGAHPLLKQITSLLKDFQKDVTPFSLLQGYLTEEFLQWNRTTYRLMLQKDQLSNSDFEEKRFERDAILVQQLLDGLHFLLRSLEPLERFGRDEGETANEKQNPATLVGAGTE